MKTFGALLVGVLCTVGYFKWDEIKTTANTLSSRFRDREKSVAVLEKKPFEAPESIPDEIKIERAEAWRNGGKRRSLDCLNRMKSAFDDKTTCPAWHYASSLASEARNAIIRFERAIGYDDYVNVANCEIAATDAMRRFEMNCRWVAGVRRGDGTRSSSVVGRWELEPGYELVNGRPMKAFVCQSCHGQGVVVRDEVCQRCGGSGSIENPRAQLREAVDLGSDIAKLFGTKVPSIRMSDVPRYIRCPECKGEKTRPKSYRCSNCDGKGKCYR